MCILQFGHPSAVRAYVQLGYPRTVRAYVYRDAVRVYVQLGSPGTVSATRMSQCKNGFDRPVTTVPT